MTRTSSASMALGSVPASSTQDVRLLPTTTGQTGLGLDIGTQRIGVASAHLSAHFARPLTTLQQPDSFLEDILNLCNSHQVAWIVLGLPRGLDGQSTKQTRLVQDFAAQLTAALVGRAMNVPLYWIDEALTSVKAEAELQVRGTAYAKADVDALAATYILEDFLQEQTMAQAVQARKLINNQTKGQY